jgi:radical SAM protein with 4Fe4S-binding SPASM domain
MDIFDYAGHFIQQLVRLHDPGRPMQIELHPGLHCDRYQCPHCFGHGQRPLAGRVLAAEEIARALDEVAHCDPLIVMSGVTTEPLTHPQAAAIIDAVRSRNLRLGLYTKGLRFDRACTEALLQGEAECFVTFSLDAFDAADYQALHAIKPGGAGRGEGTPGEAYFDRVCANIRSLYSEKLRRGHRTQVRIAILLFRENIAGDLEADLEPLTEMADLVRVAVAQDRNDGGRVPNLPEEREALLDGLAARFRGHPKIRVLAGTAVPVRAASFTRCHTQRFQVTVDKSGNLYPCPQVAVAPYGHLAYGNLRSGPLGDLLRSPERRRLFEQDVATAMRCRICDRKDEAINRALGRMDPPSPHVPPTSLSVPVGGAVVLPAHRAPGPPDDALPAAAMAEDLASPGRRGHVRG